MWSWAWFAAVCYGKNADKNTEYFIVISKSTYTRIRQNRRVSYIRLSSFSTNLSFCFLLLFSYLNCITVNCNYIMISWYFVIQKLFSSVRNDILLWNQHWLSLLLWMNKCIQPRSICQINSKLWWKKMAELV